MRPITRLATLVLAGACLVTLAPAAAAQEVVLRDQAGDMTRVSDSSDRFERLPGRRYPDIASVRFAHRPTHVVVRAGFVELEPTGKLLSAGVEVRTPDRRRFFTGLAAPGSREGFQFPDNQRPCDVDVHFDYDDDFLRMRIPRACVGTPPWVRLRFTTNLEQRDGDQLFDSAHKGFMSDSDPGPLTRRLFRG